MAQGMSESSHKYGTVRKVGRILDLFSVERSSWSVGEIARTLELPMSSTSELLSVLESEGFLRRRRTGHYSLGWRVASLNQILVDSAELQEEGRRAMEQLVSLFGETVHLAALERGQVIYLEKLEGNQAIRIDPTKVGVKIHGHCSSVGKVLLAHRSWDEVARILDTEGMPVFTPNTITAPEAFREVLQRVRSQGYAYDLEEGMLGLCCVGAPIRDLTGEVVAAMSLAVPVHRFEQHKDRYRTTLLPAAREVSKRLGYTSTRRSGKKSSKVMSADRRPPAAT